MTTKQKAQPKVQAEAEPALDHDRERHEQEPSRKEDDGSVAPVLPTAEGQGPRRSGAV